MTYSDAEKAVRDGSYKSAQDEDLGKMHQACLNVSGPNQSAVQRIRSVGEIIWEELSSREKLRREQQSSVMLSGMEDSAQSVLQGDPKNPPHSWEEPRLLKLIQDRIEESPGIEYKAAAALSREPRKMSEITKDVSAMANSAGGILIYGIAQYQDAAREHLPERIDPILRNDFSKEWFEQVIAQIQPRIPDLKICPVQLSSSPDHVVYVVEIPQGTTAHQAKDNRYYRRYNFESVPMLDHEVKDVINRKTHPRVTVSAKFVVYPRPARDGESGALIVSVTNTSDVFARYVAFVIHSPIRIRGKLISYGDATLDTGDDGCGYRLVFSNHNSAPLFPRGLLKRLFYFKYCARLEPEPDKQLNYFRWVVFADSMPMQSGSFTVDEIYSE